MIPEDIFSACIDYASEISTLEKIVNNLCRVPVINLVNRCSNSSIILGESNNDMVNSESLEISSIARISYCDAFGCSEIKAQNMVQEAVNELSDDLAKIAEKDIIKNLLSADIATRTLSLPVQRKNKDSLLD